MRPFEPLELGAPEAKTFNSALKQFSGYVAIGVLFPRNELWVAVGFSSSVLGV
jgi:hypothetical protein